MPFQLAACVEMLWQDKPIHWRAARLHEMGFGVGLWNWPEWDLDALEATGATFTIMNGYLQARLTDNEGAEMLLTSARETAQVGKRLGEARFKRSGTKSPFVFVIDTDPYPSTEPRGTWWDFGVPEGSEQAQVKAAYASYVENKKSQRMDYVEKEQHDD